MTNSYTAVGQMRVDVTCPAGKRVLGGGANISPLVTPGTALIESAPLGNTGWEAAPSLPTSTQSAQNVA